MFERRNASLHLTKRGELLLRHAEQFVHLAELVDRDVTDPQGAEGHLQLGVSETIAQCWLPELIKKLSHIYPNLAVEINVDIFTVLREALLNQEIDLAILLGPILEFSVDNIKLPAFELAWYIGSVHGDPNGTFPKLPVATFARNTRPYREIKSSLFKRVGADVRIFSSSSLSACFRLVETGVCVGALPRALARSYLQKGTIKAFDPGWAPNPLRYTASYRADPKSHMTEATALYALSVSQKYSNKKINGIVNKYSILFYVFLKASVCVRKIH